MTRKARPLKVFLCHASVDKPKVRELYRKLRANGIDAWLDEEKLLPGQDWKAEIAKALRSSDAIVVCVSTKSVNKEGFVQKEIVSALDIVEEKPEGTIFLIPTKLETCTVPERLSRWQWVDLFNKNGFELLLSSLSKRSKKVGAQSPILEARSTRTSNTQIGEGETPPSPIQKDNRKLFAGAILILTAIVFVYLAGIWSGTRQKTNTPILDTAPTLQPNRTITSQPQTTDTRILTTSSFSISKSPTLSATTTLTLPSTLAITNNVSSTQTPFLLPNARRINYGDIVKGYNSGQQEYWYFDGSMGEIVTVIVDVQDKDGEYNFSMQD